MSGARVERRLAAILAADDAGGSRLMGEDDAGTLARLAGVAHAICDISDELVADLDHSCEASGVGVGIDVTTLPLSPPASRIMAEDPDLVPRLADVGDDYELVFTSPTDASPAIECLANAVSWHARRDATATDQGQRQCSLRIFSSA